jgi:hypothetical protein
MYATKPGAAAANPSQARASQSPDRAGGSQRGGRSAASPSRDLPIYRQSQQRHLQRLRGTGPAPRSQGAGTGGWQAAHGLPGTTG